MNILYFTWISLEPAEKTGAGVHKKIYAQVNALNKGGGNLFLVFKVTQKHYRIISGNNIIDYTDISANKFYRILTSFATENNIKVAYLRNDNLTDVIALASSLRKAGLKVVLEIPTFPFIGESLNTKHGLVKSISLVKYGVLTRILGKKLNRIVTYSNDKKIWGVPTINISNGIDPDSIPLTRKKSSNIFRITAVSNPAFWHGYDRLIKGCKEYVENGYFEKQPILITMVGGREDNQEYLRLKTMVAEYKLENIIQFTGQIYGKELDEVFDNTDICVGSLGRHRSGNTDMKALKNVEFAMRGLPFCYSENNSDFDNASYVYKFPPNDSPIDLFKLYNFYQNLTFKPKEIRESVRHLSWSIQMQKVLDEIENMEHNSSNPSRKQGCRNASEI